MKYSGSCNWEKYSSDQHRPGFSPCHCSSWRQVCEIASTIYDLSHPKNSFRFGKPLNSEHPVILAYSGTHYESLIPVLDKDEMRSRKIIQRYINGEDLFSEEEEEEVIVTRGIKIQKGEPFIDHWCEHDKAKKNNVLNSDKSSYSNETIRNSDSGLDNWKDYHPASTKSELFNNNITWKSSPQQSIKTISIPINILK